MKYVYHNNQNAMKKQPNITDEERAAFREHAKGVKPLKKGSETPTVPASKRSPRPKITIRQPDVEIPRLEMDDEAAFVQPEESIQFARSGIQHRVLQKLRRGDITIEGTLDLHGLNPDQAEDSLSAFLVRAVDSGWRHVLIIHGKGAHGKAPYPILKNKVNQWLRAHPDVLAFSSANPFQGGVGAVYVLLKR